MPSKNIKAVLSIVNHNHDKLICELIDEILDNRLIQDSQITYQIVITNNIPSNINFEMKYGPQVKVIDNLLQRGFGTNHNICFQLYPSDVFIISNPDILPFSGSLHKAVMIAYNRKALVSPFLQEEGLTFFPGRKVATLRVLLFRFFKLFLQKERHVSTGYHESKFDWIAGVFLIVDSSKYRAIGGFDESLFMYYEDADFSRRLRINGTDLIAAEDLIITHLVGRSSKKNFGLLMSHVINAIRVSFFRRWKG
jgi:N-acetylglucosaminyl-diphospho-decaprenol L-rhamnosyltransferase